MEKLQSLLYRVYWFLERHIVPGAESSQNRYARIVRRYVTPGTRWLDVGCGHRLWPEWIAGQEDVARRASLLVGLDPDVESVKQNPLVHHRVAGLEFPFRDGAFTLVTANMVLEHLERPLDVLTEIRRVLAPDGLCIVHTPNALYWQMRLARRVPQRVKNALVGVSEGRRAADVYPAYYRLNTVHDLETLLPQAGLSADELMLVNTSSAGTIVLLGPLVVLELLWMRLTQRRRLRAHRTNIIGIVRPAAARGGRARPAAA
jgi:SAM-dependent methyltransferase